MSPHVPSGPETRHHPEARTIGVGFGPLSGRAAVARVRDGAELGSSAHEYRHAVIDEDTTVRGFTRELRWNQAYHRLAQSL
ncbi:hypothetical protein AB0E83_25380 [Streptomyces sp. NPDC035033]|uniref:hypothetical protein n=1 Tax=Streptomyces sp. NPDC035033 TaxID=3155368 RepID=UPI0033D79037